MSPMRTRMLALAAAGALAVLAGCNKDEATSGNPNAPPPGPTGPAVKPFDADSEPHAAGKKVMVSSGCFRCHSVDGARPTGGAPGGPGGPPGGPGGGRGPGAPDLGQVGKDPAHTPEWLTEYIQNPESKKTGSKMPKFEGKMSEDDLKALVAYLVTLKGSGSGGRGQ
jgi:mono/diheme cytochrome c family protein